MFYYILTFSPFTPSHFLPPPLPSSSPPLLPPPSSPPLLLPSPLHPSSLPRFFSLSTVLLSTSSVPHFSFLSFFLPFFLLLPPSSAVGAQFTVTPLPDILFQNNSGVHNIVQPSVIWLYCTADSATAIITWTKDGETLVNDPAHIRIRSSSSGMSTTSSLVVDNFQTPDNGDYECQARDGMMNGSSSTLSLTGGWGCERAVSQLHVGVG